MTGEFSNILKDDTIFPMSNSDNSLGIYLNDRNTRNSISQNGAHIFSLPASNINTKTTGSGSSVYQPANNFDVKILTDSKIIEMGNKEIERPRTYIYPNTKSQQERFREVTPLNPSAHFSSNYAVFNEASAGTKETAKPEQLPIVSLFNNVGQSTPPDIVNEEIYRNDIPFKSIIDSYQLHRHYPKPRDGYPKSISSPDTLHQRYPAQGPDPIHPPNVHPEKQTLTPPTIPTLTYPYHSSIQHHQNTHREQSDEYKTTPIYFDSYTPESEPLTLGYSDISVNSWQPELDSLHVYPDMLKNISDRITALPDICPCLREPQIITIHGDGCHCPALEQLAAIYHSHKHEFADGLTADDFLKIYSDELLPWYHKFSQQPVKNVEKNIFSRSYTYSESSNDWTPISVFKGN